jgi:hypothetical protein
MIILGNSEPDRGATREVRKQDISISHLVEGVTSDNPNLVISVPEASLMLAIDNSSIPHRATIYYECQPEASQVEIELIAVANEQIEPGFRFIGTLHYRAQLVAVYSRVVTA